MNVSVVIPAYNEQLCIEQSLKHIINYLKSNFNEFEVIIVDDGSNDKTYEIAAKYQDDNIRIFRNEVNRGKGYSVKRGMLAVKYQLSLFCDCDLAIPIEELKEFTEYITNHNYDIVIASRYLRTENKTVKQPALRRIMGKIFPKIVNTVLLGGFSDTQCGFKLFETKVAKKIFLLQIIEGFSFDIETLLIATKLGSRIKEMPVSCVQHKEGSTISTFKDGFKMLMDLFKIQYNNMRGKYDK